MKVGLALYLAIAASLCGCARSYVITLHNGRQVTTASKPKLQHGTYVFKDAAGKPVYVPEGRVREISPASLASSRGGDFKTGPGHR